MFSKAWKATSEAYGRFKEILFYFREEKVFHRPFYVCFNVLSSWSFPNISHKHKEVAVAGANWHQYLGTGLRQIVQQLVDEADSSSLNDPQVISDVFVRKESDFTVALSMTFVTNSLRAY